MTRLWIDPGHGGKDPGASGNGLVEKELTLKIAMKIRSYLTKHFSGVDIAITRTSDETVPLSDRTKAANNWGADYLMSIHINAGGGQGYESFIYNGGVSQKTKDVRSAIHKEMVAADLFFDRGQKTANLHMCRESKMPASLHEFGFIDNKHDASLLKNDSFLDEIAATMAEGFAKAYKLTRKKVKLPASKTSVYKVQVGAFSEKANADSLAKKLEKDGYKTYVVKE